MPENPPSAIAALRRFTRPRPPGERCELCSASIADEHAHLVEPETRRLVCSCEACAILFSGTQSARYRRVPRDVRVLPDFVMTDAQWDALHLPINLAFFLPSAPAKRVIAFYPSPAGTVESQLPLDAWQELSDANPRLAKMEPDVEALLVNRLGASRGFDRPRYYLAPIDQCYKLVGIVRTHWQGLSGGTAVWSEISRYFERLSPKHA